MLCEALADDLDSQDNRFRKGIKGDEKLFHTLFLLTSGNRFAKAGLFMERGKSTVWDSFYKVIDAILTKLGPKYIKFP